MELLKIRCPECGSTEYGNHSKYETKNNKTRNIFECRICRCMFSETRNTFMENLRKPISLIACVIRSRTEGAGLNATARTFEISKNSVLKWEKGFVRLNRAPHVYSLAHRFIKMVIEGDELYAKVGGNLPPEQPQGWTAVLMDRASRFIWDMACGRRDRKLFTKVMGKLKKLLSEPGISVCLQTVSGDTGAFFSKYVRPLSGRGGGDALRKR